LYILNEKACSMTLNFGRSYVAIPGPSVVPERVLNAMHRASPNIYEGPLHDLTDTLYPDLRAIARTENAVAIYIGNGHSAWEASLCNVLSRGDRVLALATGAFGHGWRDAAAALGARVDLLDFGRRAGIDIDRLADALKTDKSHEIKVVLATHTDTATSVRNDIAALRTCLDACSHPALLMVDCIASMACDPFEMDLWGVDVAITGSQKGLMTPPGLSFVWFNEKAAAAHTKADMVTPYWDWAPRVNASEFFRKFDGTAPVQHLYGLREALDMLLNEEGLEAVWRRHDLLARAVWAALDHWGQGGPIEINIAQEDLRSRAVTSVRIGARHGTDLRRWVEQKTGVTLGIGLGMATEDDPNSDGFFRIAHMGHVNAHMTLGVLGVIEAGLVALEIPHGPGGLAAAAAIVAQA